MTIWPIYLIYRLFFRIYEFLRHWFYDSFLALARFTISVLEELDKIFSLKITFKYLFKPLYQDYSIIGYVLGFLTRSILLIVGSVIYLIIIISAVILYLIWIYILIFIIANIFLSNQIPLSSIIIKLIP